MRHLFVNDYSSFFDSVMIAEISLPIKDTQYIPQGICCVDGKFIVSCYDALHKNNSILFVCKDKVWKKINLDCIIHCGGICYHSATDNFYITGKGVGNHSFINRYCGKNILEGKDNSTVYVDDVYCVDDKCDLYSSSAKHSSVAYITCYDDFLFLGNYIDYKEKSNGKIKKYKIKSNGDISKTYDLIVNPFSNTQGICIYKYNNEEHYIFSRSFGRKKNSIINICKLRKDGFETLATTVVPCMAEQINNCSDGLCIIFESCADKYVKSCLKALDKVYILNFCELLKNNHDYKEFKKGSSLLVSNKGIKVHNG